MTTMNDARIPSGLELSVTPTTADNTSTTTTSASALIPPAKDFPKIDRGARRRGHKQLREHPGVALPDDLDAVEDRDEQP